MSLNTSIASDLASIVCARFLVLDLDLDMEEMQLDSLIGDLQLAGDDDDFQLDLSLSLSLDNGQDDCFA